MSMIARGLAVALVVFAGSGIGPATAQELAPLSAWAQKSMQTATIDGRVARALGLNTTGQPVQLKAVSTAFMGGSRSVHLVPNGEILFSQGQARTGTWMVKNASGALLRAVEWVPPSANPAPANPATVRVCPVR